MAENEKYTSLEQAFYLGNGQDSALNWLKESKQRIAVFLISGIKLEGVVSGHDQYSLLLTDSRGNQQLIYKAKISTITQVTSNSHSHQAPFRPNPKRQPGQRTMGNSYSRNIQDN